MLRKVVLLIGLALVFALAGCGGTSDKPGPVSATPRPALPRSAWARAKLGMRQAFPHRVLRMDRQKDTSVLVGLKGDDNLTKSMIRTGLKLDAGTAFRVLHRAGYVSRAAVVQFDMPVTDTATGRESVATVAMFELRRSAARNINWKNADVIDWNVYRIMLDPVLG